MPAPSTAKLFTPGVLRSMGRELFRSIPLSSFFRVVMVELPPRSPFFARVPGTTGINDFDCFISSSSSFCCLAAASCSSVGAAEDACWMASAILTEPVSLGWSDRLRGGGMEGFGPVGGAVKEGFRECIRAEFGAKYDSDGSCMWRW